VVLLCIDDDPDDLILFKDAVRFIDNSYTCIVASNGREALMVLNTMVPDYIFLDINMPIMDGKETLRFIRKDNRLTTVPICILSTSDSKAEADYCMGLGATEWVVKPNSFEGLIRSLRGVIGGRL
jgi:CheY-like chemotaxis protein